MTEVVTRGAGQNRKQRSRKDTSDGDRPRRAAAAATSGFCITPGWFGSQVRLKLCFSPRPDGNIPAVYSRRFKVTSSLKHSEV